MQTTIIQFVNLFFREHLGFSTNRQRKMVERTLVDPFIDHAFFYI